MNSNTFMFIIVLFCWTKSALARKRPNKIEDMNEIAKEMVKKFQFVKNINNFSVYLRNNDIPLSNLESDYQDPPDRFDWRDENVVGPVKDQLDKCDAAYAFSTAGCIESHLTITQTNKTVLPLSEQFLIDCLHYGKNNAPKCGQYPLIKTYFGIVTEFHGILAMDDYRSYSGFARRCTYNYVVPDPLPVRGFVIVPSDEDKMVLALHVHGPLSAAINSKSLIKYIDRTDVDEPTDAECSPKYEDMDHAVIIVGYSVKVYKDRAIPYWIIKNSWGTEWGDKGYYYLVRGRNACGIANDVSFPIVTEQQLSRNYRNKK